jgi:hypothetical protein
MRLVVLLFSAGALAGAAAPVAAQHVPGSPTPEPAGPAPLEERTAVLYTAIGLHQVSTDFTNLSDALNMSVLAGAHLPWLTWLSGEAEFSFTVAPGNNHGGSALNNPGEACIVEPSMLDPDGTPDGCGQATTTPVPGTTRSQNDLQMTNLGGFLAARTPGPVYALARYGYRHITSSIAEIQEDKTGPAYTVGAGYRWRAGLSKFELAYSHYSEHLDYLGLGVVYGFGASAEERK